MNSAAEFRRPVPSLGEAMLNALPNPVLLVAPDGKIADANIAAESFFEISTQFLKRQSLKELVPFGSPLLALIEQVRASGSPVNEYKVDLGTPRIGGDRQVAPRTTLPITPQPRVPDDAPLAIYPYGRQPLPGAQRPTKRALAAHWIPTTYTQLGDVGGAPVFDQQQYLVGMMTGNTSRNSGHAYVLHIAAIRARLQGYLDELRSEARAYCPSCGANSRAGGAGFYYCEACGGMMPRAQYVTRQPLPQAEYYYGVSGIRCTQCGSQSGMYNGKCLRCGQTQELKR